MELKHYVGVVWKWKWIIALATLIGALSGYQADRQAAPVYLTTTSVMVGQLLQSRNPQQQDFATSQLLAQSYALLARQTPVLQAAIDELGLQMSPPELSGKVSATVLQGTSLIQISVADSSPQRARLIADELAKQVIQQSPTSQQDADRQQLEEQASALADRISKADDQLKSLDQQLSSATSARTVQDIQSQMAALQPKIDAWRTTYANLLEADNGNRLNHLEVVEPAPVPGQPISPNIRRDVLTAAAIGFLLAAGLAFALDYLDDTISTLEELEGVTKLPVLGVINQLERITSPAGHLVGIQQPLSRVAEAYRVLCTNIRFSSLSRPAKRLLVTSPGPDEGKTITAANLAIAMARAGKRVILVDADLRRPSIHALFGVPNRAGLTSLLLDETLPTESVLRQSAIEGLLVLPSGPLPPNPAELLGSEPMRRVIDRLETGAYGRLDMIVFDSHAVLGVADSTILGTLCDGVLMVVNARRTRRDALRQALATLDQVGLSTLGVVVNKYTAETLGDFASHTYGAAVLSRWRRLAAAWVAPFGINS